MAYDDFDMEQFQKKNPVEDAFGTAAMQGRMLSSSPSVVAAALGIDAARAESMDPEAIRRLGRAAARNVSVAQQQQIQTQEGKAVNVKDYLTREVGPPETEPTALKASLDVGGTTEQEQQKHFKGMIDELAGRVARGDIGGSAVPRKAIDILTYAKKMDAFYSGHGANPMGSGVAGEPATQIRPPQGTGPYEKTALAFLFDANTKILPDYTSAHDAQSMGLLPGTDLGGAAAPGSTDGITRTPGVGGGSPTFGNVGPGSGASPENVPTVGPNAQAPGVTMGGGQPTSQYTGEPPIGSPNIATPNYTPSQAGMNVPPGSPSQERMLSGQPLVQPEAPQQFPGSQAIGIGPSQAPPPAAPPAGDANVNPQGMTAPANFQQKPDPVQFALAYRAKHPTSTPAEARQVYNSLYGP